MKQSLVFSICLHDMVALAKCLVPMTYYPVVWVWKSIQALCTLARLPVNPNMDLLEAVCLPTFVEKSPDYLTL